MSSPGKATVFSAQWGSFSVSCREKETPFLLFMPFSVSQWGRKGLGDPKVIPSLGLQ